MRVATSFRSLLQFLLLLLLWPSATSQKIEQEKEDDKKNVLLPLPSSSCDTRNPLLVVPLLDGSIQAVDSKSGQLCWSFASGPPLLTSTARSLAAFAHGSRLDDESNSSTDFMAGGVVEGEEETEEEEGGTERREGSEEIVFPSVDGSLYAYQPGHNDRIPKKLPMTAKELVAASPSVTRDGGLVLGSRHTVVFMLDVRSGKVIRRLEARKEASENVENNAQEIVTQHAWDDLNWDFHNQDNFISMADALLIMRTDYTVRAVEMGSGAERWNISVGELGTLTNPMASSSLPHHANSASFLGTLKAGKDNSLKHLDPISKEETWHTSFSAAPVAVFSSTGTLLQRLFPEAHQNNDDLVYLDHSDGRTYALPTGKGPVRLGDKHGKVTRPESFGLVPLTFSTGDSREFGLVPGGKKCSSRGLTLLPNDKIGASKVYEDLACAAPNPLDSRESEKERTESLSFADSSSSNSAYSSPLYQLPPPPAPPPLPPPSPPRASAVVALVAAFCGAGLVALLSLFFRQKQSSPNSTQKENGVTIGKRKKLKKGSSASTPALMELTSDSENGNNNLTRYSSRSRGGSKGTAVQNEGKSQLGESGRWVGRLLVESTVIGYGSHGTLVLEGQLEGRPVAVKRLLAQFYEKARKEIAALIASDEHPNVVRCFAMEEDQAFVYVALERCCLSLSELIMACSPHPDSEGVPIDNVGDNPKDTLEQTAEKLSHKKGDLVLWDAKGRPSETLLQLMRDIVAGMAHVHQLGIVHRDLKPQNVLVCTVRGPGGSSLLRAKLSDMGISKRLSEGASSFDPHTSALGSAGWQAPEQLQHGRQTRAVDMFALGCVIFFCISGGRHPFGPRFERDVNIVRGISDLFAVEHIPEAVHLLQALLSPKAEDRLTASEVEKHPLFWTPEQRLTFLRETSDRMEGEDREEGSEVLAAMEAVGPVALGGSWVDKLDGALLENLGRYRRYNFRSVRDLLRVIRNKSNHYRELPQSLQEKLGPLPDGYENYFRDRFPSLLIQVYDVLKKHCSEDSIFRRYFL